MNKRYKSYKIYTEGQKLGNCWFIRNIDELDHGNRMAIFKCKCGNEFPYNVRDVKKGSVQGCISCRKKRHGEVRGAMNLVHGKSGTKEYSIWSGVKKRCTNEKSNAFSHYGGRGIKMCDRWLNSFENFLADMGPIPEGNYSIERDDVNGDYEPNNCRWLPLVEQALNKTTTRYLTYKDEKKPIGDWAKEVGIKTRSLHCRIFRYGWSVEKALTAPVDPEVGRFKKKKVPEIRYAFGFIG